MNITCKLCGGSNDIYPDEKVTRCAFCGGTIAIEENEALKKLILAHERDDEKAEAALKSFALKKTSSSVECVETNFFYVPFGRGGPGRLLHSTAADERFENISVYQPYGVFAFFEDFRGKPDAAPSGKIIIPAGTGKHSTNGTIFIPLYEVTYRFGGNEGKAYVVGETWQVIADSMPEMVETAAEPVGLLLPAILLALFIAAGFTMHGIPSRLAAVAVTGGIAHLVLSIMERTHLPWKKVH